MAFNTTAVLLISSTFISTIFNTNGSFEDHGRTPKTKPNPTQNPSHSSILEYKQSLAILATVIISFLIILALLQIKLHKDCLSTFKQQQSQMNAKILFALFMIALLMFYMNTIIFVNFIFNLNDLDEASYAYHLIFSSVPYQIGKLCMSAFFLFRLHSVFQDSALKVPNWILISLMILALIGGIMACIVYIGGPLRMFPNKSNLSAKLLSIGLTMTICTDIITIFFYVQRLIKVAANQSNVQQKKSWVTTDGDRVSQVIELKTLTFDQQNTPNISKTPHDEVGYPMDDGDDDEVISRLPTGISEKVKMKVTVNETLIKTATKSTLLSLFGIATSFWLHLDMLVLIAGDEQDDVRYRAIGSFDGAVNLICMYLVFGFAKPYYIIVCKLCDYGMGKLCKKCTKKVKLRKVSTADI